jgi:hypothetical protein
MYLLDYAHFVRFLRIIYPLPLGTLTQADQALKPFPQAHTIASNIHVLDKLPSLDGAGNWILQWPGQSGLAEGHRVKRHRFGQTQTLQTLLSSKLAVARALAASKRQLAHVEGCQIVDGNVSGLDVVDSLSQRHSVGSKHRGSKTVYRRVGQIDGLVDRLGLHHGQHGAKHLCLSNLHVGSDPNEQSGLEIMTLGVLGVGVSVSSSNELGSLGNRVGNELLQTIKMHVGNTRSDIHVVLLVDSSSNTQLGDGFSEDVEQSFVSARLGDDTLETNTVLAGRLESASQNGMSDGLEIQSIIVKDDTWVLASKLNDKRNKRLGSGSCHLVGHGFAANESHVRDLGVAGEVVSSLGPAAHELYEIGRVATGLERLTSNLNKVLRRPDDGLGSFNDDGVSSVQRRQNRPHEVMERVVPRHKGSHDAQRLIDHLGGLVEHERVGGTRS